MARIEGSTDLKTWKGSYSFAVDGGATGTITLRSNDGPLPVGSIVLGGVLAVGTALDSLGAATGALQVQSANDTINAAAYNGAPWSTTGNKDVIEDATGSTAITLTASRQPAFVIGGADLTAGVFDLYLTYR